MNASQIFKKAHQTAKTTRSLFLTYRAAFSAALREIYSELKKIVTKSKKVQAVKTFFKIIKANGTVKFAGTGEESSFSYLKDAKKLVDYSEGEMIYETDGMQLLWEVL